MSSTRSARRSTTRQCVRRSLGLLPYDDIIAICGGSEISPKAIGYIPQGMNGSSSDLPQYTYDPEKAKQLLAEAGYPNGEGIHPLTLVYLTDVSPHSKYAPLIKEAYEEIGLKIEMKPILAASSRRWLPVRRTSATISCCERAYPSINDGHDMINYQFHTWDPLIYNFSYWSSPKTDEQLEELWPMEATRTPWPRRSRSTRSRRRCSPRCRWRPLFDYKEVWAANNGSPSARRAQRVLPWVLLERRHDEVEAPAPSEGLRGGRSAC